MSQIETISSKSFCARMGAGDVLDIIDVRTGIEHKGCHLLGNHHHIPMHEFDAAAWAKNAGGKPLYILCAAGVRARKVAEQIAAHGGKPVVIEGGLNACLADGIATGQAQVISLERQVRIAAGAIILLGAVLGFFVSVGFFLICAFVGLGLVIAGITQFCGLAMALAHAPWNRDTKKEAVSESLKRFEEKTKGV